MIRKNDLIVSFFLISGALVSAAPCFAQYSTSGFFVRPHIIGSSFSLSDFDTGKDTGGGAGLGLGYGFSDKWAIFLELAGSEMTTEDDETYTLGHVDLGARFTIGGPEKKAKFILEAALTGRSAEMEILDTKVNLNGGGLTLGVVFNYFISHVVALDIGLSGTAGKVSEVKVGGIGIDTNISARSGRFLLGIVWYPGN